MDSYSNGLTIFVVHAKQVILDADLDIDVLPKAEVWKMFIHNSQALEFQHSIVVRNESYRHVLRTGPKINEFPIVGWDAMGQSLVVPPAIGVPKAYRLHLDSSFRAIG